MKSSSFLNLLYFLALSLYVGATKLTAQISSTDDITVSANAEKVVNTGIGQYFTGGLGIFMLGSFLVAVTLSIIAVLEFMRSGDWSKIQNKIVGLVLFFAISGLCLYFKAKELNVTSSLE